jgi:hypothetical protein
MVFLNGHRQALQGASPVQAVAQCFSTTNTVGLLLHQPRTAGHDRVKVLRELRKRKHKGL